MKAMHAPHLDGPLAMALLTMALLTMALLTMALLTMALLLWHLPHEEVAVVLL